MSGASIPPFILGLLKFSFGYLILKSEPFGLLPDNPNFGFFSLPEGALMLRPGAFMSILGVFKSGAVNVPLGKSRFMSGPVISGYDQCRSG